MAKNGTVMKYKLEYCPNPDVIQIHLQKRICSSMIENFESPEDKIDVWEGNVIVSKKDPPNFVKRLWEVSGIELISIEAYNLQIMKGSAFDWVDMLEQIIAILNLELFPDSKAEMLGEPKRPTEEYLKKLREAGCDV
jgi:hypothetical protein